MQPLLRTMPRVPANCAGLEAAFVAGAWAQDPKQLVTAATGGLYGLAYHINVEDAAAWGFEPAAIADWSDAKCTQPRLPNPKLGMANHRLSIVEQGNATTMTTQIG